MDVFQWPDEKGKVNKLSTSIYAFVCISTQQSTSNFSMPIYVQLLFPSFQRKTKRIEYFSAPMSARFLRLLKLRLYHGFYPYRKTNGLYNLHTQLPSYIHHIQLCIRCLSRESGRRILRRTPLTPPRPLSTPPFQKISFMNATVLLYRLYEIKFL